MDTARLLRRPVSRFLVLATTLAAAPTAAGTFWFGTDQLSFNISDASQAHWGCLAGVHVAGDPHPTNNGVLRAAAAGYTQVWRLTATACNASFPVSTWMMDSCTASCARKYLVQPTSSRTRAHMRWEGCMACPQGPGTPTCNYSLSNSSGLPAMLDIDVVVDVVGGTSKWSGTIGKENAGGICLQSFALPSMESLRFTPGQEEFFVPYMFGAKGSAEHFPWGGTMPEIAGLRGVGDQTGDQRERSWMPNGWDRTMSWTGWFSSSTQPGRASAPRRTEIGLYLGIHDPRSRLKMMPVGPIRYSPAQPLSGNLRAVHVPDSFNDDSTSSFSIPYEVVLAVVHGGWWDAAQMYRKWALPNAVWTRQGNLSQRTDTPAWLLRAPVWVRLSGNDPAAASTTQLVDGIKEQLGSGGGGSVTELGVHYYSWNTEKFDTHYPIYSARPGFASAVAKMQRMHAGVTARVVPYTNGRIWDPAGPLNTAPDSSVCSGVRFTVMNPDSGFMRDEWSSAVGNISHRYNTSGLYSDQISCSHSEACYDENATNASGWAAGSQALLAEMRRKMGPGKVLISESQDQTMLGGLHAFLSIYGWLGSMRCQTVLAWQAVYGGWTVNVGDIRYPRTPNGKSPITGKVMFNETESAAHRAISAQIFVAGGVMGWYGGSVGWENVLGLADADIAYTRLLASTKVAAAKYLTFGRLWRQPEWNLPVQTMQLHDYGYMEHDWNQSCATPKILAECWQADDGSFAVVATNHAAQPLTLNVSVDLSPAGAESRSLVQLVQPMGGRSVQVFPVGSLEQASNDAV